MVKRKENIIQISFYLISTILPNSKTTTAGHDPANLWIDNPAFCQLNYAVIKSNYSIIKQHKLVRKVGAAPTTFCFQSRHSAVELLPDGLSSWNRPNVLFAPNEALF